MRYYVHDTNIISVILRGAIHVQARVLETLRQGDVIIGCPVVWYELKRGLNARDARAQMAALEVLFARFKWQDYTRADWTRAADLWALRRTYGRPISDNDLMIAVFALNRNATLVTNNPKDFTHLGVTTENWLV